MSEFLGSRISLISKSDIRYVGVLHEINSDESTVSLENVRSFGTEGRRSRPEEEIAPSDQVYDYIIFRGSDVKDLRIEDHPAIKENKPPAMPEDPAIVNARPRPGQGSNQPPPPAPGFGQPPFQNNFYPPPGPWGPAPGRGGPGVPGAGMGGMPYPPPPGWFPPGPPGPPGQGFPPGPDGWNNYNYPPGPPGPRGPQGPQGPGGAPGQVPENRGTPGAQEAKPTPIGAAGDKQKPATPAAQGAPSEPKAAPQPGLQQAPAPTPPVESKPSVAEVKATAASLNAAGPSKPVELPVPTGPKNPARVQPAIPLAASMPKAFPVPMNENTASQSAPKAAAAPTAATVRDATEAAKAAVALAMANMNAGAAAVSAPPPQGNGNAMDNLTKKVNEMRVNAARTTPGGGRGRGRGGRQGQGQAKVDVPDADFDFAQANAKFNKDDLVKEAIAGSPLGETPTNGAAPEAPVVETTGANPPIAYNKTRSFFDNISSEAKDRAENNGQKPGGREWRGEEQRKNMETFGQGSVDGGYRGYRGRGRGRGRGYGGRGTRGGFRGRGGQGATPPAAN
ncbi:g2 m phase checkpoint control protein [Colletotrichum kahawae]|uniref:G2 m phase checkpoint control protein n=1 Tax=Colletotrichum kahawae TaxID=34407 RepID=A0AAE0D0Y1_COLKA|nr:g2 m phase checkpoint control protein [Colletotrichum kahawae]